MKNHIALFPNSGAGHILPFFRLAEKLVRHGFHISFLVIDIPVAAIKLILNSPAVQLLPNFTVVNIPAADVSSAITNDMRVITKISIINRESLKTLKATLVELNPKSLIVDIFTTDAIDVCRELSIPVYSFFTASTALLTFALHLPALHREIKGEYVALPAPVEIPGCWPIATDDLVHEVKEREHDEYKWFLLHISRLPSTSGIIVNAWEGLEPGRFKALKEHPFFKELPTPPVYPLGPLVGDVGSRTEPNAENILTWLDSQPPESVLYVGFGSAGTMSSEQLNELAWGLEMSGHRFILVARRPSDAVCLGDPLDLSAYLPDGFLERTREVGMVIWDWAPQKVVLCHQSTGAFLSHCGWNSTIESLVEGVPMITWPKSFHAEQRMTAAMLAEEVGVAVRVAAEPGREVIGREAIERVVKDVMQGEQGIAIRRRAREVRESAREALGDGGSSDLAFRRFVEVLDG